MTVRAITLWQPWASLIAWGAKTIETRSWATPYRGPLAVHAAQRPPGPAPGSAFGMGDEAMTAYDEVARAHGVVDMCALPRGAVVAIARLVDCRCTFAPGDPPPEWLDEISRADRLFGNLGPDRYGWILEAITPLPEPIPAIGHQGLWTWRVPEPLEHLLSSRFPLP